MSIFDVIVLGLVQGLTEFIPVSSSGHLVLAQHFLGVHSFILDVLLNFGTVAALVLFYRRRIGHIIQDITINRRYRLALVLMAATIPTAVTGFLFGDRIEQFNNNIWLVVAMLGVVGIVMVFAGHERPGKTLDDPGAVPLKSAAVVAFAQVVALIPGTSRSGITILAGLQQRFSARLAAEFSFMLATPTILGASLKVLLSHEGRAFVSDQPLLFILGNLVSFVSGFLAIRFLIGLLEKRGLRLFGYYRLVLAAVLVILLSVKII